MGYFAIPGISGLDLFSGTVFVSTDSTIAQTVNGVVLGMYSNLVFRFETFGAVFSTQIPCNSVQFPRFSNQF